MGNTTFGVLYIGKTDTTIGKTVRKFTNFLKEIAFHVSNLELTMKSNNGYFIEGLSQPY